MRTGVLGVKARIFEVSLHRMYQSAKSDEKVQLGRVCDAVCAIGADAVYEILRGRGFYRSCLG